MDRIVPCCLIKYRLVDFYGRSFALYHHHSFTLCIEDHYIRSFLKFVEVQSTLNLDQRFRKFLFKDQVLDKMLPYPFFGSQYRCFLRISSNIKYWSPFCVILKGYVGKFKAVGSNAICAKITFNI